MHVDSCHRQRTASARDGRCGLTDGENAAEPCSFADNGGRCQRHARSGLTDRSDQFAGSAAAGTHTAARHWCERGDSNPHALRRQNLNLVRLPIPPLSQCRRCPAIVAGMPVKKKRREARSV
ncbi:hypothetical protein XAPC_1666 [Xanthomonas citri pv. punicae str. LMG 859]|nr:hypothetical protein XAPC_1666 [Xanthomonas citri pv. punicae str. LMG 859]